MLAAAAHAWAHAHLQCMWLQWLLICHAMLPAQAMQCARHACQGHIAVAIQSRQHSAVGHPGKGLGAQQLGGLEGHLVAHLGAGVDVEAHAVVVQAGVSSCQCPGPLNLPQG